MEVRLLGPVVLWHAEREVAMIRKQPRCVLAVLAMSPGQLVSSQSLVDCVWGDQPPPSALHSLHAHVSRLRGTLAQVNADTPKLLRYGDGYLLRIDPDQVDLHRGRRLTAAARAVDGGQPADDQQVTDLLRQACALWRGTPLSGLAGDWAARVREGLAQERLTMLIERHRAELRLGEHAAVVGPVSALLAEHPLAEPLAAVQMLALYRCGQQADALEVYAQIRQGLVEEIGDEPGPELRTLHERILRRDPRLDLRPDQVEPPDTLSGQPGRPPRSDRPGRPPRPGHVPQPERVTRPGRPGRPAPAQLPADVPAFTGRTEHLSRLDAMLPDPADEPQAVGITVLEGPAGVGKTALAVRWAHRVRRRFPAGQLYANLRGFAPDPPVTPEKVLAQFLRALGVPPEDVPVDLEEAAALYRSLLADRRMLVVLDNAESVAQVRPLVPGDSGCLVLVTSRNHLPGLVARDGARPLRLDVLRPDESYALLSALLGAERVAAEPADTAALAKLCGHLPLALRIAAANLSTGASRPVAAYRKTLASGNRLTALAADGDEPAGVRATIGHSYSRLADPTRRMFRLLGLAPGPDITTEAAAALTGTTRRQARRLLAKLVAAHLADEHAPSRYSLHDLIRLFAAERAEHEEPAVERAAALNRLFEWYLRRADAASRALYPDLLRLPRRRGTGPGHATPPAGTAPADAGAIEPSARPPPPDPPAFDVASASAWLDAERHNLVDAVIHLSLHQPSELAWQLADALRGYFYLRSDTIDWLSVAQAARAAAEAAGNHLGRAAAQLSIATFHWHHSRYPQAVAEAGQALTSVRRAGWDDCEVSALNLLGISYFQSGQVDRAIGYLRQALTRDRRLGRRAEPIVLANLAAAYGQRGDLALVVAHATSASALSRRAGMRRVEAESLCTLGDAQHLMGHYRQARRYHDRARSLFQAIGSPHGEANALRGLAVVHRDLGSHERARALAQQALTTLGEGGRPLFRAECLAVLASALGAREVGGAVDTYRHALALAQRFGNRYQEVDSLIGLATMHRRRGEGEEVGRRLCQALAIARESRFRLLEGLALTVLATHRLDPAGKRGAGVAGDAARAIEIGEEALAIHLETGHRLGEARTLAVLGDARRRAGQPEVARAHQQRARELFAELGTGAGGRVSQPGGRVSQPGGRVSQPGGRVNHPGGRSAGPPAGSTGQAP
jgi:DNA-binding SARP family transcriptional activator